MWNVSKWSKGKYKIKRVKGVTANCSVPRPSYFLHYRPCQWKMSLGNFDRLIELGYPYHIAWSDKFAGQIWLKWFQLKCFTLGQRCGASGKATNSSPSRLGSNPGSNLGFIGSDHCILVGHSFFLMIAP